MPNAAAIKELVLPGQAQSGKLGFAGKVFAVALLIMWFGDPLLPASDHPGGLEWLKG